MVRSGLPVPEGFVVLTVAYRALLAALAPAGELVIHSHRLGGQEYETLLLLLS